jgi:DnaJ-domain-containing protein 1
MHFQGNISEFFFLSLSLIFFHHENVLFMLNGVLFFSALHFKHKRVNKSLREHESLLMMMQSKFEVLLLRMSGLNVYPGKKKSFFFFVNCLQIQHYFA